MNENENNENKNKEPQNTDFEQNIEPELGDQIEIIGGRFDKTKGTIYFFDETLLRILPNGVIDHLISLEVEDGALKQEYEIEDLLVLTKRNHPAFVVQQDYRVGQIAEAFRGAEGKLIGKYLIESVDEKNDIVVLRDSIDELLEIKCDFTGIPLDLEIDVLRGREAPAILVENVAEAEVEAELEEEQEEREEREELIFGEEEVFETIKGEIEEIESSLRNYPDNVQRSDMLQDFISKLNLKAQKNPLRIKEIRRLTELCLLLRNEVINYDINGTPLKQKKTSYTTLLDLVSGPAALSIPVMNVKRVLYLDEKINKDDVSQDVLIRSLEDTIKNEILYNETKIAGNENVIGTNLPNWYIGLEKYNKEQFLSWTLKEREGAKGFVQDKEFFRMPYPQDEDTTDVDGLPKIPYPTEGKFAVKITSELVSFVYISMLRGLKNRIGRLKEKESPRPLETAEQGVVDSYLLFPKVYEREFGTIRSGKLAYDIGRSMRKPRSIESIMKEKKGVSNIPTVDSILAVKNFEGDIEIEDWLQKMPLTIYGLGDALVELKSYGFDQKEFYYKQQSALLDKINTSIAHVKSHIQYIRKKTEETPKVVFENKILLTSENYEIIMEILKSEPIVEEFILEIQKRQPYYKNNDVALFAALNHYIPDLTIATLAGVPAKYRVKFNNIQYNKIRHEALLLTIKNNDKLYEPEINSCPHVRNLSTIKKVSDDAQRMQLLSKYLSEYQNYKKDNYSYCKLCDKPCLCEHEYLLLQEYLYPREKETLHKALLLNFSDGIFQGKFTCGNCGQSIANIEYDTSLEYSDTGAPMMGRAVLEDEEEKKQEEIDLMLGVQMPIKEIELDSPAKTLYYQKARELFDVIGIFPEAAAYMRIVNGIDARVLSRIPIETYTKLVTKAKAEKKTMEPYEVYRNKAIIGTLLAYAIIEIQTHIPDYVPRESSICKMDFHGYPLGTKDDLRCISYIACVSASIIQNYSKNAKIDPWALASFSTDKNNKDIIAYINLILNEILILASVQNLLNKKKASLYAMYTKSNEAKTLVESIPHGFTPILYSEIEDVIVPEAANAYEKVRGYILQNHKLAKESIKKELSPYTERTCCLGPIQKAQEFWEKQSLPSFRKNIPRGPINTHSVVPFSLRKQIVLELNISKFKDEYYKLFLKVCYDGPNVGLPHEFGYNNICPYCQLNISTLKDFDFKIQFTAKKGSDIEAAMQNRINQYNLMGLSLLKDQNIEVSESSFQKLLNAVHLKNSIENDPLLRIDNSITQSILYNIKPVPFEEWVSLLQEVFNELKTLKNASVEEYALAYGKISTYANDTMNNITELLGLGTGTILKQLLKQPVRQVVESIETAILLPLQRINMGYNLVQLELPRTGTYKELVGDIRNDINSIISDHTNFIKQLKDNVNGVAKLKITHAIQQLSIFLKVIQNYIRIPLLEGGIGLSYIINAGILGILNTMVDPNISILTYEYDNTSRVPGNILNELLKKYKSEQFKLTEDEIRIEIAKRNEKEKMLFISKFDNLNKEEKTIEKLKMKYGLGDWAIGGTKAIYQLDPKQYTIEAEQREQMFMLGTDTMETERINDGAYDNEQTAADDM